MQICKCQIHHFANLALIIEKKTFLTNDATTLFSIVFGGTLDKKLDRVVPLIVKPPDASPPLVKIKLFEIHNFALP